MVIYKTTNLVNGKYYIGKDSKNDPNYLGSGKILKRAIEKYGVDNFTKEILEVCENKNRLNEREIYWINKLSGTSIGYNIAVGGSGGDTYSNMDDESKKINRLKKSEIAKQHNVMHSKNVYDCWVDKYGEDEADKLLNERNVKQSNIMIDRMQRKIDKIDSDYGDRIVNSFKNNTIDHIHEELSGIASKKVIRAILKSRGVNTLSRKGLNNGVSNGNSKLTCEDVKRIRNLKGVNTYGEIAKTFGVSSTVIGSIIRGEAYKNC